MLKSTMSHFDAVFYHHIVLWVAMIYPVTNMLKQSYRTPMKKARPVAGSTHLSLSCVPVPGRYI
jgi:hypothetical protein